MRLSAMPILLLGILAGCWNLNSPIDPEAEAYSGSLSLRISDLVVTPSYSDVSATSSEQFSLIVTFEDGSWKDVTEEANWRSTEEEVAVVSNLAGSKGLATVSGPGMAMIEAEYGGLTTSRTGRCATFSADAVFVSDTTGSDATGTGTRSRPVQTVQRGVDLAAAIGGSAAVIVAEGTYLVTDPVVMAPEVSLYGGFDAATWIRDVDTYNSVIQNTFASPTNTQSDPDAAVEAGPGITSNSRIDGLVLVGGGGPGPAGNFSAGILCNGGSPRIVNNTIEAGTGAGHAYGVLVLNGGSPLITKNSITGKTFRDGDKSYGVHAVESSPRIVANKIDAGPQHPNRSTGVLLHEPPSATVIANNWINGGLGKESVGINLEGSTTTRIWSNTINAGTAQGGFGSGAAIAIAIEGGSPNIVNNILFSDGGPVRYGIFEVTASSDPTRLENNVVFDTPTALYVDEDLSNYNSVSDLNDWTKTTDDIANVATGNISEDPFFVDRPGGDWHLSAASPVSVTQGGFDLSGSSHYPTRGWPPEPVDHFDDYRSVPWSIGAHEY